MSDATPHRRFNLLNGSWVLVSPHRTARPWQGQTEAVADDNEPRYVADCYLCPGNARVGGETNPDYADVYVFDNDYPALLDHSQPPTPAEDPLLISAPVTGTCRVICYSPRHDLTMASMPSRDIRAVVDAWAAQYEELSAQYRWVQIFENRGEMMGCSNPHPHGQIWATDTLPTEAERELAQQQAYRLQHGRDLLEDYVAREQREETRVLIDTDHWLVVVPYWAVWPFETLVVAKDAVATMSTLTDNARDDLAEVLRRLCATYNQVFAAPFPYSMGWHNAPAGDMTGWRLHAHFYPPLLRSATIRKFMVGYELLGEAQRDLTPEAAATRLREVLVD
ncbi:MAG: UDP-glucose--hexose-1-phosphate uridylyltransferase [Pseudomonadota bacterium]